MNATHELDSRLRLCLNGRLQAAERVCVGLSGGMDSVTLLHAMQRAVSRGECPIVLSAIHVHHGLSPNADAWADFCTRLCQSSGVPLEIVRVSVPRDSGDGLEGAARRLRHGVFSQVETDWLMLAHHRDDQAETVLLNLMRGAGVAGAAGMLAERPQPSGPVLIRPLLDVPRAVVEGYAAEQGLSWIEDESNEDSHFRRNFLRHEILPRLEEKFPQARRSLARAGGHFAEAGELLDQLAQIDQERSCSSDGRLRVSALNALLPARARNLLRYVWGRAGFRAPDSRWIEEVFKQLATAGPLSEICVSTSEGALHVYRGEIYLVPLRSSAPVAPTRWNGEQTMDWGGGRVRFIPAFGQGVRKRLLDEGTVCLKPREGGERLRLNSKRPRRGLRNLMQEYGIPPWERPYLPMLWIDENLAWVAGLGCDAAFSCPEGEPGILPLWERD